jgi:hypothetical protein
LVLAFIGPSSKSAFPPPLRIINFCVRIWSDCQDYLNFIFILWGVKREEVAKWCKKCITYSFLTTDPNIIWSVTSRLSMAREGNGDAVLMLSNCARCLPVGHAHTCSGMSGISIAHKVRLLLILAHYS